jgi:predicted RNase H-like nuclease/ppGpp synthetase/RelA/SpoT-type nucleotidyltranferase
VEGGYARPGLPQVYLQAVSVATPGGTCIEVRGQSDLMYFVGVDLAWGQDRPSGVAVLDAEGRVLHVSSQGADKAIVASLTPYVADDCLVAIDAPLVVENATGTRPCEAALNRDFARFDAGAHPSNTGKPEFADVTRGARLITMLGLDMDPSSRSRRRAIEVYPHPATVALFRLGRTLKYKHKTGRPLSQLRSELLRLMGLLEGLRDSTLPLHVDANEQWKTLVTQVESAVRKTDLRRAEDQVDAVVCAYVAMFAERRPSMTTTYGDISSGYIVTPTLPEGHRPSPRTPPVLEQPPEPTMVDKDSVRRAVQTYAEMQPELRDATGRFVALVTTLLDDAGINYLTVTGRAKSVASFAAKADRSVAAGRPLYSDPLDEITDQIGVRVIAYLHSDVAAVADLLRDQLTVLDDRDMGQETASEGRFGYASRHLLVALDRARNTPPAHDALRARRAQVQVRTVLQHAWAEFEHATRYKGTIPEEHVPGLDRRFTLAAGLLELADREFSLIHDQLQATVTDRRPEPEVSDPRISAQDLATFLAGQYADAGWSRTDHYGWVSGLLLELGITSLDELAGLLTSVDSTAINARMGYRYPPGAVRRLDDALLAIFGTRYLGLHGNSHREALLRTRLERLRMPTEHADR